MVSDTIFRKEVPVETSKFVVRKMVSDTNFFLRRDACESPTQDGKLSWRLLS